MTTPLPPLTLDCYHLGHLPMQLVPASQTRQWMDDFTDRHAYRCLPLSIANAHAWVLLCPFGVEITWNGGMASEDISIRALEEIAPLTVKHFCVSNFSRGIVTMHTDYIFVTPPGWNLLCSGPANSFKDGVQPLTGIIETSWLPYPFTMNFQLTRPGTFRFEKDEPFCAVMPIPQNYLQEVVPRVFDIADNPELKAQHDMFRNNREEFMQRLRAKDESAIKQAWQRHYFTGRLPDESRPTDQHTNKLRLAMPVDAGSNPPGTSSSS